MRVEPRNFHTVAANAPNVQLEVGRLAGHRMSGPLGLQGLASDPVPARAIVIGERSDAATTELRHFLDRNQVTFEWLTSETPNIDERWGGHAPVREDGLCLRLLRPQTVFRRCRRQVAGEQRGHQHHARPGKCRPRDQHSDALASRNASPSRAS
jgi:thioredoxin reductase (NADPH)